MGSPTSTTWPGFGRTTTAPRLSRVPSSYGSRSDDLRRYFHRQGPQGDLQAGPEVSGRAADQSGAKPDRQDMLSESAISGAAMRFLLDSVQQMRLQCADHSRRAAGRSKHGYDALQG